MTTSPIQPQPADRITAAIAEIVSAAGLRSSARAAIRDFVEGLRDDAKLPHVSLYAAKARGAAGCVNYRITYRVPGYKRRTERLGLAAKPAQARARRVSEILQQVAARLMKPADAYRILYVDATPIATQLDAFVRSIRAKGRTDGYVSYIETRLRRMFEIAGYSRLTDISLASQADLIEKLRQFTDSETGRTLTPSTINDYLSILRQFTKWARSVGRLAEDPLAGATGVKNNEERRRRDVLFEELVEIVAYTRLADPLCGMSGADRAMLYLVAFATGFRKSELRSIDVAWVKLDQREIRLPATVTKNGKEAQQPLPTWLVEELKAWLADRLGKVVRAGKGRAGKLWPTIAQDTAAIFDADRAGARAAWVALGTTDEERQQREASAFLQKTTIDGDLVFHSLRHGYASSLVASGMDLKSAQILTRHSTIAILGNRYAHGRKDKAAAGVEQAIANPVRSAEKGTT